MARAIKGWDDSAIAKLPAPPKKGKQEDHWDWGPGYVQGLGLRIAHGGTRAWVVAYRPKPDANRTRRTLGYFPVMRLEEARDDAKRWFKLLQDGHEDPGLVIEQERAAVRQAAERAKLDNLRAVAEDYHKRRLSQITTGEDVWRQIDRFLLERHGARQIATITRRELATLINEVKDRSGPYMANRLTSYLKKFFKWTVTEGIIDDSPAHYLVKPFENEEKRDRVLTDAELRAFWTATAKKSAFNSAARFMLLTVCRKGEASSAEQAKVDGDAWTIPDPKNSRPHTLPLTALAKRVLADAPKVGDTFIFSTTGDAGLSGWNKAKARIDEAMLAALRKDDPKAKLKPWRLHDLRRTGATVMANCGVLPHIVEMVLNHVSGFRAGVAGVYNRAAYTAEMRDALQKLSDHVERVIA